jgi:hypothetical protein
LAKLSLRPVRWPPLKNPAGNRLNFLTVMSRLIAEKFRF